MSHPLDLWGEFLWQVGYALCHQIPVRSLFIGGYQLPVCARDTGTYLGFGIVFIYYVLGRRWRRAKLPDLAVLAVVMAGFALFAFDALSSYLGFRETTNELRLVSGLAMGLGAGVMLLTLLSFLEKGDLERRTYAWKDLLILIPTLVVAFAAVTTDLGVWWYYVISTLVIAFLILMLLSIFFNLSWILLETKAWAQNRRVVFAISVIAVILILLVMWYFHHLTEGMITQT